MNIHAASTGTGSRVLDDVAQVIGKTAALKLAVEFRGERMYVPKDPSLEPGIAETIGEELATKFCETFFGTLISIPMQAALRHAVLELVQQGDLTKRQIARRLRIREARVYAILADEVDSRQISLL